MRKLISLILLVGFHQTMAQPPFEGIIEMKMSTIDKPDMGRTKMYFSSLGGRIETEMKFSPNMKPFRTVRLYKQENPNIYYVINVPAATFTETDLSKIVREEHPDDTVTVKKVGEEKMLNYNCIHVAISGKNGVTEMWTTRELMEYIIYKNISESDARARNSSISKALIEANAEGFPVKTIIKDKKGGTITVELMKTEKKSLDKKLFEVPSSYTKTETPTTGLEGIMKEIKQMGEETVQEE